MAISFSCVCGKQLKVADEFAGKRARCPACAGVVTVPMPVVEPPAAEDAAFNMLSDGLDPEPALRNYSAPSPALKPSARQWEEVDPTPYPMNSPAEEAPAKKKSARAIPKFEGRKIERRETRERERSNVSLGPVVGGALLMIGAVVWFVVGLAADRIFFYPPFMFIGGLVGMIRGFTGHSED